MQEFTALRARAKERRDQAIRVARLEYEQAMSQIAELENRLLDRGKPKVKLLVDCVRQVMPTTEPFTIQQLMEALEALDPARIWKRVAVGNIITAPPHAAVLRAFCRLSFRSHRLPAMICISWLVRQSRLRPRRNSRCLEDLISSK
jgi:hypothetical protein